MSSISLANAPIDILGLISLNLANDPKDLLSFCSTCKKTASLLTKKPLSSVIDVYKQLLPLKKRLSELRGPNGFNGLINTAYQKCLKAESDKNAASSNLEKLMSGSNQTDLGYGNINESTSSLETIGDTYVQSLNAWADASSQFNQLIDELAVLAKFDNKGEVVSGQLFDLQQKCQAEIAKIIQDFS